MQQLCKGYLDFFSLQQNQKKRNFLHLLHVPALKTMCRTVAFNVFSVCTSTHVEKKGEKMQPGRSENICTLYLLAIPLLSILLQRTFSKSPYECACQQPTCDNLSFSTGSVFIRESFQRFLLKQKIPSMQTSCVASASTSDLIFEV